jgi:hypothetical protein
MRARRAVVVLAAAAGAYAVAHRFGRTWGATAAERRAELPGDGLVPRPLLATTHATTLAAPPAAVWPWLVQMGWHRGGWYTARWVDRLLFPENWASAEHIEPHLQSLAVGDFIPDGPPASGAGFVVTELEPERALVLLSVTHVPPSWRERFGARIDWSWVFVLEPAESGTRFLIRSRAWLAPWWLATGYWLAIVPADFVMTRQMFRGLQARVGR